MECTWYSMLLGSTLLLAVSFRLLSLFRSGTNQRPPGPPGWPIIGNIFDLGTIPHRTLYKHSFKYGPIVWLRLGSVNTMVVQSAGAAAELFKNHDLTFCDRMCPNVVTAHDYKDGSLAFGQYGANWRALRRLCTMELLVSKRINDTVPIRRKCVDDMVRCIREESAEAMARGESGAWLQ